MSNPLQPWLISADAFPAEGFASDQLEFLLNYAVLAPSTHNTQPWLFRINAMDVEVFADRRRALPVVDPHHRELTISCGAALLNLRIAAEYFGHAYRVDALPDPALPDLLARLNLGLSGETSSEDIVLFQVINRRHSNRQAFRPDPIPAGILSELTSAAEREGAWLSLHTTEESRNALADLVAEGDRRQWADREFRRELAAWLRTKPEIAADGLHVDAVGIKDWLAFAGPSLVRTFDTGRGQAARDRDIALHSPALAVLGTAEDTPAAWLAAGQALQRVLLQARAEDVWGSFLCQPVEVPELRESLGALCGVAGFPQVLVRLGYGPDTVPAARRPARESLLRHQGRHA